MEASNIKPISLLDIKQALWDERFRKLFPEHADDINEFMTNPGCACNVDLYRKLIEHKDRIQQYFPTRLIVTPKEEIEKLSQNTWAVINCNIEELEKELRNLPKGRKNLALARWENQATAVVNGLSGEDKNHWKVINTHVDRLESKLKSLPLGRKQIAIARWKDQATVVIDELEVLF